MLILHNENGLITGIQSLPETTELPHIECNSIPDELPGLINNIFLIDNGNGWELPSESKITSAVNALEYEQASITNRKKRDQLITNEVWRYERHARESRLGLTRTDDITELDAYIQALADVPEQSGFPHSINWPTLNL